MSRRCQRLALVIGVAVGLCPARGRVKGAPAGPKAKQPPGNAPTSTAIRTVRTLHGQGAL
jgi:hypothetical protein